MPAFDVRTIRIGAYAPDSAFANVSLSQSTVRVPYLEKGEVEDLGNIVAVSVPMFCATFERKKWRDGDGPCFYRWKRVS